MKKRVLIGLSGGLDSTISAMILKNQGYEVIGVHFQLWHDPKAPDFQKDLPENKCCSVRELMLARTVSKKLNIPFFVFDFRERFYKDVVQDFLDRFEKGLTPNPCVECNRNIKFGYFLEKMKDLGADFVATGHYVKNIWNEKTQEFELFRGEDSIKDQTYFLYSLTQEKLQYTLFPVGNFTKPQVRAMAIENGFEEFAQKRESQGVCFFPEKTYHEFLKRHLPNGFKIGDFKDIHTGKTLGQHTGVLFFTVGQRARIAGHIAPKYVLKTDTHTNTVWVGENEDLFQKNIFLENISWIGKPVQNGEKIELSIRHGGKPVPGIFYKNEMISESYITLQNPLRALSPGQSAVFYAGEKVLGGGIITKKSEEPL